MKTVTLPENRPAWRDGASFDIPHGDIELVVEERQWAPLSQRFIVRFRTEGRFLWAWETDLS